MAATAQSTTAADDATTTDADATQPQTLSFVVGQLVTVAARTWSGINQPGGVGHVTSVQHQAVNNDDINNNNNSNGQNQQQRQVVSVKYVIDNRHEKDIDVCYVQVYKERSKLRDRSMQMGRCGICGSLRRDCGACDFNAPQPQEQAASRRPQQASKKTMAKNDAGGLKQKKKKQKRPSLDFLLSSSSSSDENGENDDDDESSDNIEQLLEKQRRQKRENNWYRRFRLQQSSDRDRSSTSHTNRRPRHIHKESALLHLEDDYNNNDDDTTSSTETSALKTTYRRDKDENHQTKPKSSIRLTLPSSSSDDDDDVNYDNPEDSLPFQLLLLTQQERHQPATHRLSYLPSRRHHNRRIPVRVRTKRRTIPETPLSDNNNDDDDDDSSSSVNSSKQQKAMSVSSPAGSVESSSSESSSSSKNNKPRGALVPSSGRASFASNDSDDDDENAETQRRPSSSQQQHSHQFQDTELFIQPEGDAQILPCDVPDRTRGLDYPELAPFFDQCVQQLETVQLPAAKAQVVALEQKWNTISTTTSSDNNSSAATIKENKTAWLRESEKLKETLIKNLVRDGLDQCTKALSKLSSKQLFRQAQQQYKNNNAVLLPERRLEIRGFQLDAVSEAVQELIDRLVSLIRLGESHVLESIEEEESLDNDGDDNDGWADPCSQSSSVHVVAGESPLFVDNRRHSTDSFDPHPFASRKRTGHSRSTKRQHQSSSRSEATTGKRRKKKNRRHGESGSNPAMQPRSRAKKQRKHSVGRGSEKAKSHSMAADDLDLETSSESSAPGIIQSHGAAPDHDFGVLADDDDDSGSGRDTNKRRKQTASRRAARNVSNAASRNKQSSPAPDFGIFDEDDDDHYRDVAGCRDMGVRRNEVNAVTKMQRFLNANKDNDLGGAMSPASQAPEAVRPQRRRRLQDSFERRRVDISSASEKKRFEMVQQRDLQKALFSSLVDRRSTESRPAEEASESRDKSVSELCALFTADFPDVSCIRLLKDIVARLRKTADTSPGSVTRVFGSFIEVLRNHGSETLLALVSRESPSLRAHVRLIATTLEIVHLGLHSHLQPSDGVAYHIFSPERCDRFASLVLLQMVDTVYAVVHPSAWALRLQNPGRILDILEPLRSALGQHLPHLPEATCRCVINELEVQRWHLTSDSRHAYVSSVNPSSWSSYLASGEPPQKAASQNIRLTAFNDGFPRCEVDALWSLLAYFSSAEATSNYQQTYYWNLVSKMFSRGVLATGTDSSTLPPSKQHLDATISEIQKLTTMLVQVRLCIEQRKDTIIMANIVRSALLLQGDDYLHNEDSRLASFPSLRNEKRDKKAIRSFWRKALDDSFPLRTTVSQVGCYDFAKEMEKSKEAFASFSEPLLLPSSLLLRSCAGLVAAWIARVPENEVRQSRVVHAINALVKQLVDDGSGSHDHSMNSGDEMDAFARAFSLPQKHGHEGTGTVRRELALREAAAFLTIVTEMVRGQQAGSFLKSNLKLSETVWELLADDVMRKRRAEVAKVDEPLPGGALYFSDNLRLYLAAKAMTFTSLLFLGVPPWTENLLCPCTFTTFFPKDDSTSDTSLLFLFSCLCSCLDCARDSKSSEIMTSVSSFMGTLLSRVRQLMVDCPEELGRLEQGIQNLRKNILQLTLQSFSRCFAVITSATCCGAEEDLCLFSLFNLLKGVLLVAEPVAACESRVENIVEAEPPARDDLWGDLDDDIFASLDLSGAKANDPFHGETRSTLANVWDLLIDSIELAKPSIRFVIDPPNGRDNSDSVTMSSQGKSLIGRHANAVCCCLAAIAGLEGSSRTEMLVSKFIAPATDTARDAEKDDIDFTKTVAQSISRELVACASTSGQVLKTLRENPFPIALNLFEQFLAIAILEKLPSCNLPRIRSRSGEDGEKREFTSLMRIGEEGSRASVKKASTKLWNSCAKLGQILSVEGGVQNGIVRLGDCLLKRDPDLPHFRHKLVSLCLEKECLDRFRLFRGICSSSSVDELRHLASLVLVSSADQLAKLQEEMLSLHGTSQNHSGAKLLELYSCYYELHMSWIAWIFREMSASSFDHVRGLWTRLCEGYLSPMVRGQALDIRATAQWVVSNHATNTIGVALSDGGSDGQRSSGQCIPSEIASGCVFRRSREFMICIAREFVRCEETQSGALFNALLAAAVSGTNWTSRTFSYAFCSHLGCQSLSLRQDQHEAAVSSPLHSEINEYLTEFENVFPLDRGDDLALLKLKRYTLENVLIPRLCHARTDTSEKRGILFLLQQMFHTERCEDTSVDTGSRIDIRALCSLAQGIRISFQAALADLMVNNDLVESAYRCAKELTNLPAACVDKQKVGWLIDWCYSEREKDDSSPEPAYLWSFLFWLRTVGETLLDSDPTSSAKIDVLRAEARFLKTKDWNGSQIPGTISWGTMMQLEEQVQLPNNRTAIRNVTNVYSSSRNSDDAKVPACIDRWVPTSDLRRSVTTFVSKVRAAEVKTSQSY